MFWILSRLSRPTLHIMISSQHISTHTSMSHGTLINWSPQRVPCLDHHDSATRKPKSTHTSILSHMLSKCLDSTLPAYSILEWVIRQWHCMVPLNSAFGSCTEILQWHRPLPDRISCRQSVRHANNWAWSWTWMTSHKCCLRMLPIANQTPSISQGDDW